MAISNLKGQFIQGQTQKIKVPSKQHPVMFDSEMPRVESPYKTDGRIMPKRGAI